MLTTKFAKRIILINPIKRFNSTILHGKVETIINNEKNDTPDANKCCSAQSLHLEYLKKQAEHYSNLVLFSGIGVATCFAYQSLTGFIMFSTVFGYSVFAHIDVQKHLNFSSFLNSKCCKK